MDRKSGKIEDKQFFEIEQYLNPGDLLIANETRVLPARLQGKKRGTGGDSEILLLKKVSENSDVCLWEALVKPGRRLKPNSLSDNLSSTKSKSAGLTGPIVDFFQDNEVVLSAEIVD